MSDDQDHDAVRQLATNLRGALEAYWASGTPACQAGCMCPLSRAIASAVHFIDCVERFDAGELLMPHDGLPTFLLPEKP